MTTLSAVCPLVKPKVLLVIDSDPRTSARPAEAIRVAAGLSAWQRVDVTVYLRSAAVLALQAHGEDLKDADNLRQYLPLLAKSETRVYVDGDDSLLEKIGEAAIRFARGSPSELAALSARSEYLLRF